MTYAYAICSAGGIRLEHVSAFTHSGGSPSSGSHSDAWALCLDVRHGHKRWLPVSIRDTRSTAERALPHQEPPLRHGSGRGA
ncbi:hypothetical protein ACFVX6_01185 [Streptomyces sp. NPDC058289]|uniref:hypothetical protein n=1 Tax=Streptomyces sp. NPDC058289 TaxID=3346425 RepID=UPI0036E8BD36